MLNKNKGKDGNYTVIRKEIYTSEKVIESENEESDEKKRNLRDKIIEKNNKSNAQKKSKLLGKIFGEIEKVNGKTIDNDEEQEEITEEYIQKTEKIRKDDMNSISEKDIEKEESVKSSITKANSSIRKSELREKKPRFNNVRDNEEDENENEKERHYFSGGRNSHTKYKRNINEDNNQNYNNKDTYYKYESNKAKNEDELFSPSRRYNRGEKIESEIIYKKKNKNNTTNEDNDSQENNKYIKTEKRTYRYENNYNENGNDNDNDNDNNNDYGENETQKRIKVNRIYEKRKKEKRYNYKNSSDDNEDNTFKINSKGKLTVYSTERDRKYKKYINREDYDIDEESNGSRDRRDSSKKKKTRYNNVHDNNKDSSKKNKSLINKKRFKYNYYINTNEEEETESKDSQEIEETEESKESSDGKEKDIDIKLEIKGKCKCKCKCKHKCFKIPKEIVYSKKKVKKGSHSIKGPININLKLEINTKKHSGKKVIKTITQKVSESEDTDEEKYLKEKAYRLKIWTKMKWKHILN